MQSQTLPCTGYWLKNKKLNKFFQAVAHWLLVEKRQIYSGWWTNWCLLTRSILKEEKKKVEIYKTRFFPLVFTQSRDWKYLFFRAYDQLPAILLNKFLGRRGREENIGEFLSYLTYTYFWNVCKFVPMPFLSWSDNSFPSWHKNNDSGLKIFILF